MKEISQRTHEDKSAVKLSLGAQEVLYLTIYGVKSTTKKLNPSLDPYALSQTFSFNGFVSLMLFSRWLCSIINLSCMSSNHVKI